jgi:plastocyanin
METRFMRLLLLLAGIALATSVAQAQTGEIVAAVNDDKAQPLENVVVVAVPTDGVMHMPTRTREAIVDQVNKEFMPVVTAILVGTSVVFPNHDNVRHQVYSFSPGKRFELPLYGGVPSAPVLFDKAGVVVLGCNIHDWMVGYIYVSESPYFAITGKDGKAALLDLPLRRYTVRVWHPQSEIAEEATLKTVDLSQVHTAKLAWTLTTHAETKVRRAPTAERGGRY